MQDIFSVQTVWSIVSCFDNFHFQNLRTFEVDLVEKTGGIETLKLGAIECVGLSPPAWE